MNELSRGHALLIALVIGLALTVAIESVFLFGLDKSFHGLLGRTSDDKTITPMDDAPAPEQPQGGSNPIQPLKPLAIKPFDPMNWDPWKNMDPNAWDPWKEMAEMHERMNTMFGEAFGRFQNSPKFGGLTGGLAFSPKLDIQEEEDRYVIKMDVPGADVTNMKVSIENGMLTVQGTRQQEKREGEPGKALRTERQIGQFQRTFPLPGPVDPDSLKTEYKDGVYTITVNKEQPPH